MKLWQAVIVGLLMAVLPIVGACSLDKPYYSSDEVVVILKQQLNLSDLGSLTQDRYGATLIGKPIIMNFRLHDWEAKYLGNSKWQVYAQAHYKEGRSTQTCKCIWHFNERNDTIEYIGNGEQS